MSARNLMTGLLIAAVSCGVCFAGGAATPKGVIDGLSAAYKAGDKKAISQLFHAANEKEESLVASMSALAVTMPKLKAFVESGKAKFGEQEFGGSLGPMGMMFMMMGGGTEMFENLDKMVIEENGDTATATFTRKTENRGEQTDSMKLMKFDGVWYLADHKEMANDPNSEMLVKMAEALVAFVPPAQQAVNDSATIAEFQKNITPHLQKIMSAMPGPAVPPPPPGAGAP